jgi:DNA-binding MarR family transcriptional regulator
MKQLVNLEEKTGYLIYQLNLLWKREISRVIAEFDLTYTQYLVLMATAWLEGREGTEQTTQAQISSFLHIDRMMVSRMVQKLINLNLIAYNKQEAQGRTQPIHTTERGMQILRKAVPEILLNEAEFYSCLTEQEHQNLNSLLIKVLSSNQSNEQKQSTD